MMMRDYHHHRREARGRTGQSSPSPPPSRRPPPFFRATATATAATAAALLVLLAMPAARVVDAGMTFGDVVVAASDLDDCRSALQSASSTPDGSAGGRVDRVGYVAFVNEMSEDDALTSFRYDGATKEWGDFPIESFEELPQSVRGVFYEVACGGAFVACEGAYLHAPGTREDGGGGGGGGAMTDPQAEVYLFGLCEGVRDAIDAELDKKLSGMDDDGDDDDDDDGGSVVDAPSSSPSARTNATVHDAPSIAAATTGRPTTAGPATADDATTVGGPSGEEEATIVVLAYRAAVSANVSSGELNRPDCDGDGDGDDHRARLLGAVYEWADRTASEWRDRGGGGLGVFDRRAEAGAASADARAGGGGASSSSLRGRRRRRREGGDRGLGLSVHPKLSVGTVGTFSMHVVDVGECGAVRRAHYCFFISGDP